LIGRTDNQQEIDKVEAKGMVSVGAYRLAYSCMGTGSPVVVLEAALGAPRMMWDNIIPAIAEFTSVIRYDRGSLGESERAGRRRTLPDVVGDLKAMLDALGVPGPYLLVGSSFGGYIIRYFAYQYPEEVAGLVMIDSSHPDDKSRTLALLQPPMPGESDFVKTMRSGLEHEIYIDDREKDPEGIDYPACDAQAREISSLGDLLLVVIGAGNHKKDEGDPIHDPALVPVELSEAIEQMHRELQEDLSRLSTRGRFVVAWESGHFVHWYEPELVVGIIKEMVEQYRARPK
jgi:pimeloyl-ACP methyl ester carboxylesterase